MRVNDYRVYGFEIKTDENGAHYAFCKSLIGGGTQEYEKKDIFAMCKDFVLDATGYYYSKFKLTPAAEKIKDGETPIDIGLDNALKIVWRNLMVKERIRPSEMADMMKISPQALNQFMRFNKSTKIEVIDRAFTLLGHPMEIRAK